MGDTDHDPTENCPLCRQVAEALSGDHPRFVLATKHLIVMVGEHQFFPGYCVVVTREHARELFDLQPEVISEISTVLSGLGAAISYEWNALKMNYASLGNVVEHMHWHVIPRQKAETNLTKHPWFDEERFAAFVTTNEKAKEVANRLTTPLKLKLEKL